MGYGWDVAELLQKIAEQARELQDAAGTIKSLEADLDSLRDENVSLVAEIQDLQDSIASANL